MNFISQLYLLELEESHGEETAEKTDQANQGDAPAEQHQVSKAEHETGRS